MAKSIPLLKESQMQTKPGREKILSDIEYAMKGKVTNKNTKWIILKKFLVKFTLKSHLKVEGTLWRPHTENLLGINDRDPMFEMHVDGDRHIIYMTRDKELTYVRVMKGEEIDHGLVWVGNWGLYVKTYYPLAMQHR